MRLSLVIPTYNERENISKLISKIDKHFKKHKIDGELIVVDDNSPDGTGEILENLKKDYSFLKVKHRTGKLGLSSAVLDGFSIAKGEILGVMDADLSHPIDKIYTLFRIIDYNEADFVIGSRYIQGGDIKGWGTYRKLLSKGATLFARVFTNVKDPMSGFFMIKRDCIKNIEVNPKGFKILLELIIKAKYKNIIEVPITFINRKEGKSKAGVSEIIFYLYNLYGYLPYKKNVFVEFFKFAFVGLIGTILNLLVLYYLTDKLGVYYLISAFFAFCIAVTSNFFLNKIFTFKENLAEKTLSKFTQFLLISIVALVVNLFFLYLLTSVFGIYYLVSQAIAIAIALSINFLGNKIWTFSK